VGLAISDVHAGLKMAIARCFQGCSWQRCRVHFARNLLVKVPKASQDMVAAALRSVFVQQRATAVPAQWDQVITMLTEKFPAAAALIGRGQGRCPGIPILSTGALAQDLEHQPPGEAQRRTERGAALLPIKRRTRVVGIFPNDVAIIRLVGALLLEQQEEWQLEGRRVFSELSMAKLDNNDNQGQDQLTAALAAAA
jgi:putative transposase